MAFVNEAISDADKARIDWTRFRVTPNGLWVLNPQRWTIDRKRNIFLIRITSGHPDHSRPVYALSWKDIFIRVHTKGTWEIRKLGDWEITDVKIPTNLDAYRNEILQALREAAKVYGVVCDGPYENAEINISKPE